MEASKSLKRSLQDQDTPDSASKRVKHLDASVEAPSEGLKGEREYDTQGQQNKRSKKQDKRVGRRSRRGTRDAAEGEEASNRSKLPRLPKRQCALLIGFCGSGYSGMQIQPDHEKTIEGVLFQAMVRAGVVSQDNADDPVKIGLARAARTDAGVHAAGNLVSLKMITTVPDVPDVVARINEELPADIRLWGYVRVQNSFNARLSVASIWSTFENNLLKHHVRPGGLDRALHQYTSTLPPELQTSTVDASTAHPFWAGSDLSSHEGELSRKRAWRIPEDQLRRLRTIVGKFEGTHNFHNFTAGREFSDRSNQRHMKKIEINDPVVYSDTEWISVLFHGQSFMLHQVAQAFHDLSKDLTEFNRQIRKMMAALVLTCRTGTPEQVIDELYGPRVVLVPKMPSLGLLLEEPVFDSYNNRMAIVSEKLEPSDPNYRPPISFEAYRSSIDAFKQKHIYENMQHIEDRNGLFDAWMRHLDAYSGNDLLYLNPRGTIPQAAVLKKGERRENPFREKRRFDKTSFTEDEQTKLSEDEEEEEIPTDKKNLADTEG